MCNFNERIIQLLSLSSPMGQHPFDNLSNNHPIPKHGLYTRNTIIQTDLSSLSNIACNKFVYNKQINQVHTYTGCQNTTRVVIIHIHFLTAVNTSKYIHSDYHLSPTLAHPDNLPHVYQNNCVNEYLYRNTVQMLVMVSENQCIQSNNTQLPYCF